MSSSTINQLCDEFQRQIETITIDQIQIYCDNILVEFNQNQDNITELNLVVTIFNSIKPEQMNDSRVFDHPIFIVLRDALIPLMRTGRNTQTIHPYATNVSSLISYITFKFVNDHVETFKRLLIYKPLIDELSVCIDKCTQNLMDRSEEFIGILNNLLFAYNHLARKRPDIQDHSSLTILIETVAKCFSSPNYDKMLQHAGEQSEMSAREEFFFEKCPIFLHQYRTQSRRQILNDVRKILLPLFNKRLPFKQINKSVIEALGSISAVLFIRAHQMMTNEQFYHQYEELLSHLMTMLSITNQMKKSNDAIRIELIQEIVEQLSNFISIEQYVGKMKELQASSLLLIIVDSIQDEATHFHIYRILAAILTEKDIKTLAAPDKIVMIFLKKVHDIIEKTYQREPLSNVLIALKSLTQHDQIKDEIIKQQGLPLLIRCAIEPELIEQGEGNQWSLDILLALTFNKEGFNSMKSNTQLIDHLKTLLSSTNDEEKRSAEGILWKLEKENKDIETTIVSSDNQYDIMISYSHRNKDVCYDIYDRLIKDGYRVWLDRENMHSSPMEAMAHAIENSQYILVCMSDAYKQSPCCQLEANYAFQRQRPLIPLIMVSRYRPDGWLGLMVSGKIYIDIPKLTIDVAYENLKKEIDAHRKQRESAEHPSSRKKPIVHDSVPLTPVKSEVLPVIEAVSGAQQLVMDYPLCIDDWSDDHVRSFLIDKKLNTLLPVVVNMNGRVLHMMYSMCVDKPESMYDRLKADTPKEQPLNMSTYLRFLTEIKQYVPNSTNKKSTYTSSSCSLI